MDADTRKPVEPWQIDDAARLKALFRTHTTMSQLEFGAAHDIGTQSAVGQYLNGARPLNVAVALKFARGLGVPVSAFSTTIAAQIAGTEAMDPIGEAVSALPESDRQQVLDFIQYRWQRAGELVASERAARYVTMIESIKADMAQRTKDDEGD
jgi:hypothetical protein